MPTTHPDLAATGLSSWDGSALRREADRLAAMPRTWEPTVAEVLADEARAAVDDDREPFDGGSFDVEAPAGRAGRRPSMADLDAVLTEITRVEAQVAALHGRRAELVAQAARLAEDLESELLDDHDPNARAATSSRRLELARRALVADLAAALHIGERAAESLTERAGVLTTRAPRTLTALRAGELSWAHATQVAKHLADLSPTQAAEVENTVLAGDTGSTPAQLGDRARKIRELFHPVPLDVRHADAATHRAVWLDDGRDGMAWLTAHLPAPVAHAAYDRLTRTATLLRDGDPAPATGRDHPRTPGQARADVLAALLLDDGTLDLAATTDHGVTTDHGDATGHDVTTRSGAGDPRPRSPGPPTNRSGDQPGSTDRPGGPPQDPLLELLCRQRYLATLARSVRPRITVTVPVLTLLGASEAPGTLDGCVPIDPQNARLLAALAPSFRRILTHPETGAALSVGRTSYAVPADLKALLAQRDVTCRFPGCRRPAQRTDLDHTIAWTDGGTTDAGNLAHLCRAHHVAKHQTAWTVRQVPDAGRLSRTGGAGGTASMGGVLEWTSPTGRVHRTYPERPTATVHPRTPSPFAPDPEPDDPGDTHLSIVDPGPPPF